VGPAEDKKPIDADILKCKKDILRASDIIPPFIVPKRTEKQKSGKSAALPGRNKNISLDDTVSLSVEAMSGSEKTIEIPKLDLTQQILASHRKITSTKRRSPGFESEPEVPKPEIKAIEAGVKQSRSSLSIRDSIISEIVARDLERLYNGEY